MTVVGRGYDGGGSAGMTEAAARKRLWWAVVALRRVRSLGGRLGSCLRRNDGEGGWRREVGWVLVTSRYPRRSAGMTELFCAGMTVVGARV